jgi:ABC-type uncharacterized transport system substrate-binding protein
MPARRRKRSREPERSARRWMIKMNREHASATNPAHGWISRILFALILCALSLSIGAQKAQKVPRVGYLAAVSASAHAPRLEAFRQGLRELGYVEGQNIIVEYRHEDRDFKQLDSLAAELVTMKVDVLVAVTTNAALAAKRAAGSIPVVFLGVRILPWTRI